MNSASPEAIAELLNKVEKLSNNVTALMQEVQAIKIDQQNGLPANRAITPGIGTKVAYDKNGLILQSMSLVPEDIPNIEIDKVTGLKQRLDAIADTVTLKKVVAELKNQIPKRSATAIGSGTKVNYDENGFIVSSSNLLADDIPKLPMSKIEGLPDVIDIIQNLSQSPSATSVDSSGKKINPGTKTKITYDENGRVVSGANLTMDDIPSELITSINEIRTSLIRLAPRETVDTLMKNFSTSLQRNDPITGGEFTKVTVDSKGLVTKGSKLSIKDLPELNVDDIKNLRSILNDTATQNQIIDINETLSSLMNRLPEMSTLMTLESTIKMKADRRKVDELEDDMRMVKETLRQMDEISSYQMINEQLDKIMSKISSLEGRVLIVEQNIDMGDV